MNQLNEFELTQPLDVLFEDKAVRDYCLNADDGIGLREGDGIDDYRSQKELVALRRQDEKENWQAIPFV